MNGETAQTLSGGSGSTRCKWLEKFLVCKTLRIEVALAWSQMTVESLLGTQAFLWVSMTPR